MTRRLANDIALGAQSQSEHSVLRPGGGTATMLATLAPALDVAGTPRVWVCTYTDITHLKNTEAALREHAAELKDTNQLKNALMAMLAHEIAQPLATIVITAELLSEEEHPSPSWRPTPSPPARSWSTSPTLSPACFASSAQSRTSTPTCRLG